MSTVFDKQLTKSLVGTHKIFYITHTDRPRSISGREKEIMQNKQMDVCMLSHV